MKKTTNNKGFSLIELIIVIAIMAVLVGVLAPAYLRYVEKTRLQKDNSAVGEVCAALQAAMADEECYNEAADAAAVTVATLDKTNGLKYAGALKNLEAEAADVVAAYALTSKEYTKDGATGITIVVNKGKIYVAGFVDDAGDAPTAAFNASAITDKMGLYPTGLTTTKAAE